MEDPTSLPVGVRDSRRSFTSSQRAALFVRAHGRCSTCALELGPGWHADHVQPWSQGGATDLDNGQALCKACNLKKGSKVQQPLWRWQEDNIAAFLKGQGAFLCEAAPGAGKTRFALELANRLRVDGVDKVLVLVHTRALKYQWAQAAAEMGLHLDPDFAARQGRWARDFDGAIMTYQAVAAEPDLVGLLVDDRTFVICDEIHHVASPLSWGTSTEQVLYRAWRVLLLSGTAFRTDGAPISLVNYNDDGEAIPDCRVTYGQTLSDGVARPVEFVAMDSNLRWFSMEHAGRPDQVSQVKDQDLPDAFRAILDPHGEHMTSVLEEAHKELAHHRQDMPNAAGLVFAKDQAHARQLASVMQRITGRKPRLAVSDDKDAQRIIKNFSRSNEEWLIAVRMVSEGVDIPRATVGVYATNVRTEMAFRQMVGRFVRKCGPDDEMTSVIFLPSIQKLLQFAKDIEGVVTAFMKEPDWPPKGPRDWPPPPPPPPPQKLVLAESASSAWHDQTVRGGEVYTAERIKQGIQVKEMAKSLGMTLQGTDAQFVQLLDEMQGKYLSNPSSQGNATNGATHTVQPRTMTLAEAKKKLKTRANQLANAYARRTGREPREVNTWLMHEQGVRIHEATEDQLKERVQMLEKMIAEAR